MHYLIGFQPMAISYSLTVQPCKSMLVPQKRDSTMSITLLINSQPLERVLVYGPETLKQLNAAFISPHLEYTTTVWDPHLSKGHSLQLQ